MKSLLLSLLLAAAVLPAAFAQNVTIQKAPATATGANKLTDSSKVIVVGDGGSISATGTGEINATSVAGGSISPTAPLTGGGAISGTVVIGIPKATSSVDGYLFHTDWATFNAKQSALTFSPPLSLSGSTASIPAATSSVNGYLTSADWTTFNGKESVLTFSAPLARATNAISIPAATGSVNGYLSSADWTAFNAKQAAGNYMTALTGDVVAAGPGSSAATIAAGHVTNAMLANSTVTVGTTSIALGASATSIAGMASIAGASSGASIAFGAGANGNLTLTPAGTGQAILPNATPVYISAASGNAPWRVFSAPALSPDANDEVLYLTSNARFNPTTGWNAPDNSLLGTISMQIENHWTANNTINTAEWNLDFNSAAGTPYSYGRALAFIHDWPTGANSWKFGVSNSNWGLIIDGTGSLVGTALTSAGPLTVTTGAITTYDGTINGRAVGGNGLTLNTKDSTLPIVFKLDANEAGRFTAGTGSDGALLLGGAIDVGGSTQLQVKTTGGGIVVDSGAASSGTYPGLQLKGSGAGWGTGIQLRNTGTGGKTWGVYAGPTNGRLHFTDETEGQEWLTVNPGTAGVGTAVVGWTTAATSTASGALQVAGGVGIGGALYAASIQNTPIGNVTASSAAFTTAAASTSVSTPIVQAAAGNSNTLVLKSNTSGGTATTFLTGNADQSTTLAGNATVGGGTITGGAGGLTVVASANNGATITLQPTTSGHVAISPTGTSVPVLDLYRGGVQKWELYADGSDVVTIRDAVNGFNALTLSLGSAGFAAINYATFSTSASTGALVVAGGIGVGDRINVASTIDASSGAGSINTAGGIYVAKKIMSLAATFDGVGAAITGINAITAASTQNLTLNGGSTGSWLQLNQGGVAGLTMRMLAKPSNGNTTGFTQNAPFNLTIGGAAFTGNGSTFWDDVLYFGHNFTDGGARIDTGKSAVGLAMEADYWNNVSGSWAHHNEFHVQAITTTGTSWRPLSLAWDRDTPSNYAASSVSIAANSNGYFTILDTVGSELYYFGGNGQVRFPSATTISFSGSGANAPTIQNSTNNANINYTVAGSGVHNFSGQVNVANLAVATALTLESTTPATITFTTSGSSVGSMLWEGGVAVYTAGTKKWVFGSSGILGFNGMGVISSAASTDLSLQASGGGASGAQLTLGQGAAGLATIALPGGSAYANVSGAADFQARITGTSGANAGLRIIGNATGSRAQLSLETNNGTARNWYIRNVGGGFSINDNTASTTPFEIDATAPTDTLYVRNSGNVNIGGSSDISGSGGLKIHGSTASTSTTSGSLVNVGGIGSGGAIHVGGDAAIDTAGKTLIVKSGTNAAAGTVTLVAGAATITSTAIDANTVILFSEKTVGGTPGVYQPLAAVSSGSAAVTSAATDTSTYNWVAMKVN